MPRRTTDGAAAANTDQNNEEQNVAQPSIPNIHHKIRLVDPSYADD